MTSNALAGHRGPCFDHASRTPIWAAVMFDLPIDLPSRHGSLGAVVFNSALLSLWKSVSAVVRLDAPAPPLARRGRDAPGIEADCHQHPTELTYQGARVVHAKVGGSAASAVLVPSHDVFSIVGPHVGHGPTWTRPGSPSWRPTNQDPPEAVPGVPRPEPSGST